MDPAAAHASAIASSSRPPLPMPPPSPASGTSASASAVRIPLIERIRVHAWTPPPFWGHLAPPAVPAAVPAATAATATVTGSAGANAPSSIPVPVPAPLAPLPPPSLLDSLYPFQVRCSELSSSLSHPLLIHWRDSATILYRVQNHVRKIVPTIINQQGNMLATCRAAQRGVLDLVDSVAILDTLNAPVARSLADVARRATHCAAMVQGEAAQRREEEAARARRVAMRLDAEEEDEAAYLDDAGEMDNDGYQEGEAEEGDPSSSPSRTGMRMPSHSPSTPAPGHDVSLASAAPSASPSASSTPSRRTSMQPTAASSAQAGTQGQTSGGGGGGNTVAASASARGGGGGAGPRTPRHHSVGGATTPKHLTPSALRGRLASAASPSPSPLDKVHEEQGGGSRGGDDGGGGTLPPPRALLLLGSPLSSPPSSSSSSSRLSSHILLPSSLIALHPSESLANPHDQELHEHADPTVKEGKGVSEWIVE